MKKTKTILSILLTAVMLLTMFTAVPFSVGAAQTAKLSASEESFDKIFEVGTAEELINARNEINSSTGKNYLIKLTDDIVGGELTIETENTVTVYGENHTISAIDSMIVATNGAVINLGKDGYEKTLTVTKNNNGNNDVPGAVSIASNSVCNMYNGVTIKDCNGNNYLGGGVTNNGGTFNMYGGTIDNCGIDGGSMCYGGGVAVINGGLFNMNGGVIKNCYAVSDYVSDTDASRRYTAMGGGVFVSDGSTFIMNRGTISNNTATNFGGGVAMALSNAELVNLSGNTGDLDLGNPRSKIEINNGVISGNKAKSGAGVFASGYFYAYASIFQREPLGSGLPSDPGIYVNDAEISSNQADEMGGGVLTVGMKESRKAQIHNARILNNTADSGAGVENYYFWTQLEIDSCTITGNSATSNGGGVAAVQNENNGISTFGYTLIKDTEITDNTSGDRGAGVYYDDISEIRISGADVIQDNTYNGKLNNLNVLSFEKPVKVVGDLAGSQIGLSDPTLWDDGKEDTDAEAVSTKRLTDGYKTNNASLIPADAFTSDHESWYVDYGEKKTEQGAETGRTYNYKADKYDNVVNVVDGSRIVKQGTKQFICLKAETFDSGTASDVGTVYSDMLARYQRKYEDKGTTVYGDPYFYDSASGKYVTLYQWGTMVYIYIGDYDAVYNETDADCDCLMYAGVSHQQYAKSGEIVYQYQAVSPDASLFVSPSYESTASQTDMDLSFSTALDFNGEDTTVLYERNDIGIIVSKYVINKSSEVVDIQYDTITTDYTNEVRLVRKTTPVKFHVNNPTVADETERNNELFRIYNAEEGNTDNPEDGKHSLNSKYQISEFYNIPAFAEDDYVFAGWYYDTDGTSDGDIPFEFDSEIPANLSDVYAHWIPVGTVSKADSDDKVLPSAMNNTYSGFGLFGVQIRPEAQFDQNMGEYYYGGLRFISSISESLLSDIDDLSTEKVGSNNVEYGYVTAAKSTIDTVAGNADMGIDKSKYKIQYKGENVNGVDTLLNNATSEERKTPNNFRYVTNVDCTSQVGEYGNDPSVKIDHKNFSSYRLMTFVVNYTGENAESDKGKDVVARAYIRYYDANGLLRTFYNDYGGTNVYGGCSTSFNTVKNAITGDIKTEVKK
ncbi:MAG: hypothetical protein IJ903_06400 [Ruminococcus sp.]|nr:hypothetical protein [Ruminococcus sp.]